MSKNSFSKIPAYNLTAVSSFEKVLKKDWWKTKFTKTYLLTDSDVTGDEITKIEIENFLAITKVKQASRLLDICCGQGRHCLELARRGFSEVEGLDYSDYLIKVATKKAKKDKARIKFKIGDIRHLPYPDNSFDIITSLGNSFGYFETKADDLLSLEEVFRVLKPGGGFFLDVVDIQQLKTNFEQNSWSWIDKNHVTCWERTISEEKQRIYGRALTLHIKKGIVEDSIYSTKYYRANELNELFDSVGFKSSQGVTAHNVDTSAYPNAGMMGARNQLFVLKPEAPSPNR